MKTAYVFVFITVLLSIGSGVNESGARVAIVESRQQHNDEVVTGVYEGYKNQTVNMLLKDGTRMAYPFKSDKALLRRISKTPLSVRVTIKVKNGLVVRFEEGY